MLEPCAECGSFWRISHSHFLFQSVGRPFVNPVPDYPEVRWEQILNLMSDPRTCAATDCIHQVTKHPVTSLTKSRVALTFPRESLILLWTLRLAQCRGPTTCLSVNRTFCCRIRVHDTRHKQANWQHLCGDQSHLPKKIGFAVRVCRSQWRERVWYAASLRCRGTVSFWMTYSQFPSEHQDTMTKYS